LAPLDLFHWDFSERNPLDGSPDNGQTTHLRGKHVNLVSPLPNIAEETLDGVGRSNVAVHRLRKAIKGESFVFLLTETRDGFGVEFAIFGFEGDAVSNFV
jgi:hypothetical protein